MNDEQLLRYSRHIFLPQIDIDGQLALCDSHVLVIGLGGLGAAALPYLAASGIGQLTLVDDDRVELSNLPRQIIHPQDRVGMSKAESAAATVMQLNHDVRVHTEIRRADAAWLEQVLPQFSLVLDCTDEPLVRYALNKAALKHRIPWVSAAAVAMNGQLTVFDPRRADSPCYRCLYPDVQPDQRNCSESGVLSPLVGVIGTLQAVEALKLLSAAGESLCGRLLSFDARASRFHEWRITRRPDCADCAAQS
ncbi:molybdopterin-synthase adenylyltransferase MoeB [Thalassolituus sp. C2-1]|uniref:HesA/MoeB/ThiF family protein n=1 Tax=Venatorbacter sp. C2-1 TaxID=2597518 RepID=UPI001197A7E5|nr:molybdopterin-synthase adenylyltransferase MoeB [Thalassolituus sp. C2-1]TVV44966.1 molybdopterin-synthase adenylyltransferase MoeB [Thalassolituus sp. C2-1]